MNRTLFAAAAAVATAALIVPLVATADHRPGHKNTALTIEADPNVQVWPRTVTVSGTLRGPDNAGKTIELDANTYPFTGGFTSVGTTTTNSQGDYSFPAVKLSNHTTYRARATNVQPRETSAEEIVRSRMKITRRVSDRTPPDGGTITFSGRVGPAHQGMNVLIQRRRPSGTWRTMTTAPLGPALSDGTSAYSAEIEMNRDGRWRARVRADADHFGNKSRRVRINVN
jgi:hypothetical protein